MGATGLEFRGVLGADGNTFSFFRLLFTTPMGVGGCDLMCVTEFGRFATARNRVNIQRRTTDANGMLALDLFGARFAVARRQVSEPGALGLIAFGLGAQAVIAWRRRRAGQTSAA